MRHLYYAAFVLLFCAATLRAEDLKVAEEHRSQGIVALQESQNTPRQVVSAARHFAKAAAIFEKLGDTDGAVEMNSFLYWCKKKMTLDDIEAFTKAGEVAVAEKLNAIETQKVEKTDAQTWYDRAENFAKAKPDEHLLIAIRFFEVADRFAGTDVSLKAQRKSLDEQQLALKSAPAKPEPKQTTPARPNVTAAKKAAMPDAAALKESEKTIKDIFKDEYAKRGVEDKKTLGSKLLRQANEVGDDLAAKFVALREAKDLATQAGDFVTATRAIDEIAKHFAAETSSMRLDALKRAAPLVITPEALKELTETYLAAIDEAVATDNYDTANRLVTDGDAVARRARDVALVTKMQARTKEVKEIQTEFARVKEAKNKLAANPADPEANTIVGTFNCYVKNDWKLGLPHLANAGDVMLKQAAEKELDGPRSGEDQAALGELWWGIAEKETRKPAKQRIQLHAKEWFQRAVPQSKGLVLSKIWSKIRQAPESDASVRKPHVSKGRILDRTFSDSLLVLNPGLHAGPGFKKPSVIVKRNDSWTTHDNFFGKNDVVCIVPISDKVVATCSFAAITENNSGTLVFSFLNEPTGDCEADIQVGDKVVKTVTIGGDKWKTENIPFNSQPVTVIVRATGWWREYCYMTYEVEME